MQWFQKRVELRKIEVVKCFSIMYYNFYLLFSNVLHPLLIHIFLGPLCKWKFIFTIIKFYFISFPSSLLNYSNMRIDEKNDWDVHLKKPPVGCSLAEVNTHTSQVKVLQRKKRPDSHSRPFSLVQKSTLIKVAQVWKACGIWRDRTTKGCFREIETSELP